MKVKMKQVIVAISVLGLLLGLLLSYAAAACRAPGWEGRDEGSSDREWGHNAAGVTQTAGTWYLAEGCTASGDVVCERSMYGESTRKMEPPMDGDPMYPFTREESIACGHWPPGSLDYPYFGAPRSNSRIHAGIDVYPPTGQGSPLRAIKVGLFYTRYTGEKTYAVLVDHGDFVANYAEIRLPALVAGSTLETGDLIGYISGTRQLHFEMYTPGTTDWLWRYGEQPVNLLDPTQMMLELYDLG